MTRWMDAQRLVIKIGSATVANPETYRVRESWLCALAADIAQCRARGQQVVLVSSGAMTLGRGIAPQLKGSASMERKQALAACGQIALMTAYQDAFRSTGLTIAQVLLTLRDSEHRSSYLNARHTLGTLLEAGIIPVVNENDTVATTEIRVGDNDRLAARVAEMISAEALILLSDIDGLYTADPRHDPSATLLPEVRAITPAIEAMAGGVGSAIASGGMATKIAAAKMALAAGCHMAIMQGAEERPLTRLASGEPCTWFISNQTPRSARKKWISGALRSEGTLWLDQGAVGALQSGKSLLPVGIVRVEGEFARGALVRINNPQGQEVGRGLIAYDASEARAIAGKHSDLIPEILGYAGRQECMHRDDLVVMGEEHGGISAKAAPSA